MGFLTRDQIQNARDAVTEAVDVPEWGGQVLVKSLSGTERDSYEKSILIKVGRGRKATQDVNLTNARAKLAVLAVVDEQGKPLFTEADIGWLGAKSAAALGRVAEVAMRLAGLTDDDMEELTGNSEKRQPDDFVTA